MRLQHLKKRIDAQFVGLLLKLLLASLPVQPALASSQSPTGSQLREAGGPFALSGTKRLGTLPHAGDGTHNRTSPVHLLSAASPMNPHEPLEVNRARDHTDRRCRPFALQRRVKFLLWPGSPPLTSLPNRQGGGDLRFPTVRRTGLCVFLEPRWLSIRVYSYTHTRPQYRRIHRSARAHATAQSRCWPHAYVGPTGHLRERHANAGRITTNDANGTSTLAPPLRREDQPPTARPIAGGESSRRAVPPARSTRWSFSDEIGTNSDESLVALSDINLLRSTLVDTISTTIRAHHEDGAHSSSVYRSAIRSQPKRDESSRAG